RNADPAHRSFGRLAGSALTLNAGVRNLLTWFPDWPPGDVWAMATENPARLLGWRRRGHLRPGAEADLVLWNADLTPARVWVGGVEVDLNRQT
ncbi:MAG: amidohydrolase family protein, partial [Candidatus Marinimicrobia bacterium]|nr:amidohydrolase family protein [Candidatus Neomarinimicrobiota bacterium]